MNELIEPCEYEIVKINYNKNGKRLKQKVLFRTDDIIEAFNQIDLEIFNEIKDEVEFISTEFGINVVEKDSKKILIEFRIDEIELV